MSRRLAQGYFQRSTVVNQELRQHGQTDLGSNPGSVTSCRTLGKFLSLATSKSHLTDSFGFVVKIYLESNHFSSPPPAPGMLVTLIQVTSLLD